MRGESVNNEETPVIQSDSKSRSNIVQAEQTYTQSKSNFAQAVQTEVFKNQILMSRENQERAKFIHQNVPFLLCLNIQSLRSVRDELKLNWKHTKINLQL